MPLQPFQMHEETHTEFEVAVERELHGALTEPEAVKLAEHLSGCASCRAYQQSAIEMESNMEAVGNLFSKGVEWGRMRAVLDERVQDLRSRMVMMPVVMVVAIAVLLLAGHQRPSARGIVLDVLALAFAYYVRRRRLLSVEQRAKAAEGSSASLFELFAEEHRRGNRMAWLSIALLVPVGAWSAFEMLARPKPVAVIACALVVFALIDTIQRLVRLRRERSLLRA